MVRASNFKVGTNANPRDLEKYFDMPQILKLASQLKVEITKNLPFQDYIILFKSKQFICNVKSNFLARINSAVNQSNDVDLQFERSQFQFYKGFVGYGNNA